MVQSRYSEFACTDSEGSDNECETVQQVVPKRTKKNKKSKKVIIESDSDSSDSDSNSDEEIEENGDVFMTCHEYFDQHKLNHILKRKKKYKKKMRDSCFEDNHNPFAIMEKYLKKSRKGRIEVEYKQNNGVGRFFAVKSLSMQSLPREIRHTIGNKYVDVDVVNAHPVILSHLCKKRGIETKYLDRYIDNRDGLLSELNVDRETGKTAVLSFLNGGSKDYENLNHKPKWIKKMKKEIGKIHDKFAEDSDFKTHVKKLEDNKDKDTYNAKGSYMNILLCHFENTILQCMYEFFGNPDDCVLCFDGLMLSPHLAIDDEKLRACEEHVLDKLDIDIVLKVKPMTEGFKITKAKKYEDPVWYYHHRTDFCKQGANMNIEELKDWMKETCITALNRGNVLVFTKNLEVDGSIWYQPQEKPQITDFKWKVPDPETGKSMTMSMNGIFESQVKNQNAWDYINFIPYLTKQQKARISPRVFNTFSEFRWDYRKITYSLDNNGLPVPPDSIKPWINHIKRTLCKPGQSNIDGGLGHRILQWHAHLFQNPTVKPWALVFQSEEGIGKGLWQTFFEQVITKGLTAVFSTWEQITGSFNGKMAGKMLFTLNEATNYPTKTQKELVKTIIKDKDLQVNKKFINQYDIDNYARVLITTNNKRPVSIDYDDRRYCCIISDNSVRGNKDYFAPLIESRYDEQVQHDMFDYLTNYPLDGFNSEKPPMTKWKRDLIGQNLESTMEFVKCVCAGEVSSYDWDDADDDVLKIKGEQLYKDYMEWCAVFGEMKTGSGRAFTAELKKHGLIKKRLSFGESRALGYEFDKNALKATFAKLLCNTDFEF